MAHRIHVSTRLHRLLALTLLLLTAGCSLAEPLIRGVVVEEGSNKPLPDATVYIAWQSYGSGAGHSRSGCAHIDFTQSDAQGNFELPGGGSRSYVQAYKPGYVWFYREDQIGNPRLDPLTKPQTVLMKPFSGSVTEWLDVSGKILSAQGLCRGLKEAEADLSLFYRRLYEDAKAFAAKSATPLTEQEKSRFRGFLFDIESLGTNGFEAIKRLKERSLRGEY